jgi:riboflavin kinase
MVDDILLFLARSGAHRAPARLTTTEIGLALGMSQQNVSRRLQLLERNGKITRGTAGVSLTSEGVSDMRDVLATLQNAFSAKLEMRGKIVDGFGEGRFYLSRQGYRRQVREKLGFAPYPGTLNLKLGPDEAGKRGRLLQLEPVLIEGFQEGERRYGDLFAYPAKADGVECAVVVPLRTHHGHDIIELTAAVNLRERLGKGTGDDITLKID